jgi:4-hydroxyproline epimerase
VVDSHTVGEPTRVVVQGGPDLGTGPLAARVERFRALYDSYRSAVVNEPRGSDVLVGALLVEPDDPSCAAGVIFFNNVGYLGMCGHGMMGVVATLAHLGRIAPGQQRIETPVGIVTVALGADGRISVTNVPSYRKARQAAIDVPGMGPIAGDVAWGGNWFFLCDQHGQAIERSKVEQLTDFAWRVRQAVNSSGYPEVDHIELFGPPTQPGCNSKNFVLCPGKAYDRSPCGTGTSAKLACLVADGRLREGDVWRQEGILGSVFEGRVQVLGDKIIPTVSGRAYITGTATLLIDPHDPFAWGIGT